MRLFQKISRFMVRDMSLQDVLRGVVDLVVEFTQCDSCLLYLLDGEELVLCASNTPHPSTIGKIRLRWAEGLTGQAKEEFLNLKMSDLLDSGDKYLDRSFVKELSSKKNF